MLAALSESGVETRLYKKWHFRSQRSVTFSKKQIHILMKKVRYCDFSPSGCHTSIIFTNKLNSSPDISGPTSPALRSPWQLSY